MKARVEQDRHACSLGKCVAPAPRRATAGRKVDTCVPRKIWWLRICYDAGKRRSIAYTTGLEARMAATPRGPGPILETE